MAEEIKPKTENSIRFLTLADYVTPAKTENEKEGWVEYGSDNLFFDYLIELYNNSPTNNACIRGTANLIYGQGIDAVNSRFNLQGYVNLKTVFAANDVRNVCNDLKAFGMAAFELMSDGEPIERALHLPMNYLRSGIADDEGNVREWFYATNWADSTKQDFEATAIPVFGFHGKAKRSIIVLQPYSFGSFYYSSPDYIGALNWADTESEISQFHLSNLRNGMWPGMLINFNNGVPPEDDQIKIERDVQKKWGKASKAGRVIIAWNRDKDSAATIEPVQLSDAAEQFKTVSDEAMQKILLGHRITSPMLLGIKENTGLGNNAEELKSAHALFVNTVVRPMQEVIIEGMKKVLNHNGYSLDLYFKPLTPLEFKDYSIPLDAATRQKETGVEMSAISDDAADFLIGLGEVIDEDIYEELDNSPVNYETNDKLEDYVRGFEVALASVVSSQPNRASEQDNPIFKIRYDYFPKLNSSNSRMFCRKMVAANKVYRKEDIVAAGSQVVNAGFGIDGADTYSIWLWKGSVSCKHLWHRRIYMRRDNKRITVNEARKMLMEIDPFLRDKFRLPQNEPEVATRPFDMPNQGGYRPNGKIAGGG